MIKGVTVIEARLDDSSVYCGCRREMESVSDAAKIANMVVTGAGEIPNLFRERQCRVKYESEIFWQTGWDIGTL